MAELVRHRAAHGWPADGCCANCGTPLAGHWCYACGQAAHDHHRSLRHLLMEMVESLTHADGRLWHTLFLLALRPGQLTRDYLRGRRASEIPPLRLFFVALLLVFATSSLVVSHRTHTVMSASDRAETHDALAKMEADHKSKITPWIAVHVRRAVDDPSALIDHMREWGERFAFLLLPLSAIALRMLFPFRRDVGLYDHLIFTMHSLAFVGLVWVAYVVLHELLHIPSIITFWLLLTPIVHLFVHMRGTYATGVFGTLLRMALLGTFTSFVFLFLLTGLVLVSLGTLEG